jgi:phage anti-repressor protein
MKELIEIKTNKEGIQTVSARLLHEKLEVKTEFSHWITRMIDYGFEKNKDYTVLKNGCNTVVKNDDGTIIKNKCNRNKKGQFTSIDYFITLDMAKEICMLQRSDIGKQFRRYFIKCERILKEHIEIRNKSKIVRNNFTDTLKEHGYTKPHEYIQTTKQMKNTLGITSKKSEMNDKELSLITASELLAKSSITDEYGYSEVNPICTDASEYIAKFIEERKLKKIAEKRA